MDASSTLKEWASLLAAEASDAALAALLPAFAEAAQLEQALALLLAHPTPRKTLAKACREALASRFPARQSEWHFDAERQLLRLWYARRGPAASLLPADFSRLVLSQAAARFRLALSLEKKPRPILRFGPPLPLGTEGLDECLELMLAEAPGTGDPVAALNTGIPEGLCFLRAECLPPHATPAAELARLAHWTWPCSPEDAPEVRSTLAGFMASETWSIRKSGKQDGQKTLKEVEVRHLVEALSWEGDTLAFGLRLEPGQALHPAKLLGGLLGWEPARIQGLVRRGIDLAPDPRIAAPERFQPKLKNMFEDAVLLRAEGHIVLVEDDDEEPLRLG